MAALAGMVTLIGLVPILALVTDVKPGIAVGVPVVIEYCVPVVAE